MPENWRESDEKEFKICRILYGADFLSDVPAHWRGSGIFV